MKRLVSIIVAMAIIINCGLNVLAIDNTEEVSIVLNGDAKFYNAFVNDGVSMAEVKLFEDCGISVIHQSEKENVQMYKDANTLTLSKSTATGYFNGEEVKASPPLMVNSELYLPVRIVMENFGYEVKWENESVNITEKTAEEENNGQTEAEAIDYSTYPLGEEIF